MERLVVGTEVVVIRGNDKGKRGKVSRVLRDRNKVVVEGIKTVKRHLKPTPTRGGGILQVEAAFPASHVQPVDPQSGKPTRVKVKTEGDKKSRVGKSGAALTVVKES